MSENSEIQMDPTQNGGSTEVKGSSTESSSIKSPSIKSTTESKFNLDVKEFLKTYKYEILLGIIIVGSIIFKLWNEKNNIMKYFNTKPDLNAIYESKKIPKIIWMYWNDPIEKAPEIVQMCVNLIMKFNKDFKIYLLNENSYKEYVQDEEIIKIMNSKLNHNYKSDLLRLYLVYNYGGIYIDSSTLPFQSFEWIIDLMNKSPKNLLMYKNNHHTTDKNKPICENWMIVSKKNNPVIKIIMVNFKLSLQNGPINSYKSLIKDNTVNYQNFISHGPFHLAYFVIANTLQKNNLHDKIEYLDCSYNSFPCMTIPNNLILNKIFLSKYEDNFEDFRNKNKFMKLTSYNRKYLKYYDIKSNEGSIIDMLLKI